MAHDLPRESSGQRGNYKPTSLDFINRPNPVEPSATSHGNYSSTSRQLENQANEEILRVLRGHRIPQSSRDPSSSAGVLVNHAAAHVSAGSIASVLNNDADVAQPRFWPGQQPRRDLDQSVYTLPQLPVKRGVKRQRQRVPPVLQGLHQPPPNAGLLPSISTEDNKTSTRPSRDDALQPPAVDQASTVSPVVDDASNEAAETELKVLKRNKWTDNETANLLQGVSRFGMGNWKKILSCTDFSFNKRTATDLKDRFRVCYSRKVAKDQVSTNGSYPHSQAHNDTPQAAAAVPQEKEAAHLPPFPESKRRRRTKYTAQEDDALLKGFTKYGASWTSIQLDPVLAHRKPTDLRDRLRTRFPDIYSKAGLATKASKPTKPSPRSQQPDQSNTTTTTDALDARTDNSPTQMRSTAKAAQEDRNPKATPDKPMSMFAAPTSSFDDDWLAGLRLPDDDEDMDTDPIVLDRSIMDWANQNLPSFTSSSRAGPSELEVGNMHSIDPLITLNLPKTGG